MKVSCPDCNVLSRGRWCLDQRCDACDGEGLDDDENLCWQCDGAGHIICPTCKGVGYVADPNVSSEAPTTEDAR